jgi:putative ABC transport system ATP-binding protein
MSELTGPRGQAGDRVPGRAPVPAARALCKDYGRGAGLVRAVDGVDLTVAAGETLAVMGPSGCGKSTLLHLLGGLDRPSAGEIWLSGQRIDPMGERALARLRREAVGFVFQAFHLMDELTAVENVELPALLAGTSPGRPAAGRAGCWSRSAWRTGPGSCPPRYPAASGSGSRSPARWPTSRW